jgi:uncharacterized surface protein with fasciclin (FAS1) repeats
VASDPSFSTLVSLVKAAGLAGTLGDRKRTMTVFAPTNSAFRKLEKAVPGVTKALTDPKNKKLLVSVLRYHMVGTDISSGIAFRAADENGKIGTLLGSNANGRLAPGRKGVTFTLRDSAGINTATVIEMDIVADNGAIHVIDKVLVPKSVAAALEKAGLID